MSRSHLLLWLLAALSLATPGCALITALNEESEDDGVDMASAPDLAPPSDMVVAPDMDNLQGFDTFGNCVQACESSMSSKLCVFDEGPKRYRCATNAEVHEGCVRAEAIKEEDRGFRSTVHATLTPVGVAVLVQNLGGVEGVDFGAAPAPMRLAAPLNGARHLIRMLGGVGFDQLNVIFELVADQAGDVYTFITAVRDSEALGMSGTALTMGTAQRPIARCTSSGQHIFATPYAGEGGTRLAALFCDKAGASESWYVGGFISAPNVFNTTYLSPPFTVENASAPRPVGAAFRLTPAGPEAVAVTTRMGETYAFRVYPFNPQQPLDMPPGVDGPVFAMPPSASDPARCPLDRMVRGDQTPISWFDAAARLFVANAGPQGYAISAPPNGGVHLFSQVCRESTIFHTMRAGVFAPKIGASVVALERGVSQLAELVIELVSQTPAAPITLLRPIEGTYSDLRAHSVLANRDRTVLVGTRSNANSLPKRQVFIMDLNIEGRPVCR